MVALIFLPGTLAVAQLGGGLGGLLGGLLGNIIDPVGLGYDAKTATSGGYTEQHVIPVMEKCTDNGNGTFTARWGYNNQNSGSVSIPIGTYNRFVGNPPVSQNLGQPTTFLPGLKTSVFNTNFTGDRLTWIIKEKTASIQSCDCVPGCPFQDSLLKENWNSFDATRWQGDGDQVVEDGFFTIRPLAFSAFADWKNASPVVLEANAELHLSQIFKLEYPLIQLTDQSAAVYMVNKDKDGTFENYVFVNIGYTGIPDNKFFVEIFGADGGVGFDQFVETPITSTPQKSLTVDLRITRNSYTVAVDGMVVNSINLVDTLPHIDLFQVGVQRNLLGLEGFIDGTFIYKTCR